MTPTEPTEPTAVPPAQSDRVISHSLVIDAPAERIFALLRNPRRHHEFDGSGTVRAAISGPELLSKGDSFGMRMALFGVPLPYRITNRVVEFEQDRLIAWRHFGGHRWRYELEPVEGGTRVTESFDYTAYPDGAAAALQRAGYPQRNSDAIAATLPRLAAVVTE